MDYSCIDARQKYNDKRLQIRFYHWDIQVPYYNTNLIVCVISCSTLQDNLLKYLFSNSLQFCSLNRFSFALRGRSHKTKHTRSLLMETTEIFDFFTDNISIVSSSFDHNDAEVRIQILLLASGILKQYFQKNMFVYLSAWQQ